MFVVTAMSPLAAGALRVQVIVILTPELVVVVSSQLLLKSMLNGWTLLLTFHVYAEPRFAPIVLRMLCGAISLTGIETSLAPMPEVPKVWFVRFVCSEEPGYRCEPSARRANPSKTQVAPAFWEIV